MDKILTKSELASHHEAKVGECWKDTKFERRYAGRCDFWFSIFKQDIACYKIVHLIVASNALLNYFLKQAEFAKTQ